MRNFTIRGQGWFLCAFVFLAVLLGGPLGVALSARSGCPRGTVAVEDVATGQVKCEREDSLDSREVRPAPPKLPEVPAAPASPGAPGAPSAPEAPAKYPVSGADCGLARWGCEESCNRTHLSQSLAEGSASAQRAKVALAACLRACGQEFQCESRAPETPSR